MKKLPNGLECIFWSLMTVRSWQVPLEAKLCQFQHVRIYPMIISFEMKTNINQESTDKPQNAQFHKVKQEKTFVKKVLFTLFCLLKIAQHCGITKVQGALLLDQRLPYKSMSQMLVLHSTRILFKCTIILVLCTR